MPTQATAAPVQHETPADFRGNNPRSTLELLDWHARAAPAGAIDSHMPIVDPHHHLFGSSADKLFYEVDDFQRDLDSGHRVIGTVYVEAYQSGWRDSGPQEFRPVGEVEKIVSVTAKPVRTKLGDCKVASGIVCFADLGVGEKISGVLDAHVEAGQGRVRGVRQRLATVGGVLGRMTPDLRKPHLMAEPEFRKGFAQLERHALIFDAWVYHTQLDELADLARAFPRTSVVVNHVGGPLGVAEFRSTRADVLKQWRRSISLLASMPNVFVKLGGLGMPILGHGFERFATPPTADELAQAWNPAVETCVESFGTARCMFESNFPVDKQSCSYSDLWNAYKLMTRRYSLDERADLFYRTACRVYGLGELERIGNDLLWSL